jgi:hypothetical protein
MPRTVSRPSTSDNPKLVLPHPVHEGRTSIKPKKNFFWGSPGRKPTEENGDFQTAGRR